MEGACHRVHLLVVVCCLPFLVDAAAAGTLCYTAGGVAGIVIGTIVVTLLVLASAVAAVWYWRKRRRGGQPPHGENGNSKPGDEGNGKFAFDNPYFRDDDATDAAEKGRMGSVSADSATSVPSSAGVQNDKPSKMKRPKMKTFSSVFNPSKKPRTMDDCFLNPEPERTTVSLRGHDFTGLGFNICGNMRDGIFVKDVLHRGPASESGKITAGDRILSVTVSLSNMVYEDALTILSYASPYDVQLEIEKTTGERAAHLPPSSSMRRLAGSNSFSAGGQRLFHPLYRSQSIDDLTQIGKDSYPSHGIAPKRSQSIGMTAQRLKAQFQGHEDCLPEEGGVDRSRSSSLKQEPVSSDGTLQTSRVDGHTRTSSEGTPSGQAVVQPLPAVQQCSPETGEGCPVIVRVPSQEDDRSLTRKAGKRKAPLPPRVPHLSTLETTAQVHHRDLCFDTESGEVTEKPRVNGTSAPAEEDSLEEKDDAEPDSGSDVSGDSLELGRRHPRVQKTSSSERKASSLGDLTQLEESSTKKSPVPLERAVSMDLQQQALPEGNLRTFGDGLLPGADQDVQQVKIHKQRSNDNGESEWTQVSTPLTNNSGTRIRDGVSRLAVGGKSPSVSSISSDDSPSLRPAVPKRKTRTDSGPDEVRRRSKEVIEISESELDDVMMSHRQFLLRQAQATGHYGALNPAEAPAASIQFESWSFQDGAWQRTVNGSGESSSGADRYPKDEDSLPGKGAPKRTVPEVTTYSVRGSEGNLTQTVVITTTPDRNSLTTSVTSHSPPPALQPPH